ncbi:NAD(P)-binding protein [Bradyrhizobium manausense]|uniref:NAD(P)-binding protein n=1 Tax=Bradyrhizobium manausense TaxID=989370 RepID=UPI001BA8BD7C|nr:NAD(P)-binding protein [Bradyrhizobium manausense]MBR0829842.1 NAD(P)-binding protein [Bradyrhizobium manausense]
MASVTGNETWPQNVAILGGGIGAISTAFMLTDPKLRGRYEVTIYCMGWRLGGKGASGRNAAFHQRVEEHGLHLWFGAYRNAISLMKACYDELGRAAHEPLSRFEEAFRPQSRVVLTERVGGEWRPWPIDFIELPPFPDVPTVYGLYELIRGYIGRNRRVSRAIRAYQGRVATPGDLEVLLTLGRRDLHVHTMNRVVSPERGFGPEDRRAESLALKELAQSIWAALVRRGLDDDRDRRFWVITYLGITIARGILDDELYEKGFDSVDGEELRAWLGRHSSFSAVDDARPDRLAFWSPAIQAFYDASFSYADGRPEQPSVAASTGVRCILRILFDFGEAFSYEMQAGMGDSVFAPFYQCLKKRGVKFEFFSRVVGLGVDASHQRIETIQISQQVTVRDGRAYEPLINVLGLPCWPNEPQFDQLVEGSALKKCGANLEHWDSGWRDVGGHTLHAGRHFDRVVLAISHAVLPHVAQRLCEVSPAWKATVELESVATQAWQIWFRRRRDELGMGRVPEIFGGFVQPWSSLVDFSQVLHVEGWNPPRQPHYLAYSCGTLPKGESGDATSVKRRAKAFLSDAARLLWPGAYNGDGFDWSTLHAENADNEARLDQQYFRGNVDLASLYVTARPNTRQLRIRADQTGFDNLTVAGEWTDTGVNISSIEATVISGMRASRAISGFPSTIAGEHDA